MRQFLRGQLSISIPKGTIQSGKEKKDTCFFKISIPKGTIQRRKLHNKQRRDFYFNSKRYNSKYVYHFMLFWELQISIPKGTIQRRFDFPDWAGGGEFQFQKVQFKEIAASGLRKTELFQFQKVQFKGYKNSLAFLEQIFQFQKVQFKEKY